MRASTLFAITLSMLLGLGAAAGARYAGLFDKKDPPPAEAPKPPPMVLAARANLFEGVTVSYEMTEVRPLRGDEEADYRSNPAKFMPPSTLAAHQRVSKKNIGAGSILLKEYFEELELPGSATAKLDPGTTMVNLPVLKEKAAGGTIRYGDYVDVVLSTRVSMPGYGDSIKNGVIVRGAKVVMKRNTTIQILKDDPVGQPIYFGLQMNPYRAALTEYALALNRGDFTLRPVPAAAKKPGLGAWSDPTSKEYADEDQRVELIAKGEYTVSDIDLARVLNIVPPAPPAPVPPPVRVDAVAGTSPAGGWTFPGNATGQTVTPRQGVQPAGGGAMFTPPSQPGPNDAPAGGCKNCKK